MTVAAVILHPHPGMGGDSRHPLVTTIDRHLVEQGIVTSTPDISDADVAGAAADLVHHARGLVTTTGAERLVLVGYSWGSIVSSHVGIEGLVGRALIAPPVGMMSLAPDDGQPTLILVPDDDEFGGPEAVAHAVTPRDGLSIETVDGCDHFLVGAVDRVATRVSEWVATL